MQIGTKIHVKTHFGGRIMLVYDTYEIGARLLAIRKNAGLTQSEAAERAGISDRTYADIERGTVNMRVETLLKICRTFHITPDDILTERQMDIAHENELLESLNARSAKERKTAFMLLEVYLKSLE